MLDVATFLARRRSGTLPGVPAGAGARAELVAGRVHLPPLPTPEAAAALAGLGVRLEQVGRDGAIVAFGPALRLGPRDVLRPPLAVLRSGPRFGQGVLRTPSELLLAVEVIPGPGVASGGTRRPDRSARAAHAEESRVRDLRLPRYAAAGVPEVWVLELGREWGEALRSPGAGAYRSRTLVYPGEALAPRAWPGAAVTLLG